MAERMQLEYQVSVTGLGEAAIAAEDAGRSAEQATAAINNVRTQTSRTLPILLMGVRSVNAARLAVEQTSKAIEDLDPRAAIYGFLNMMQVTRNLTSLMTMLKESTGAASAAQAILATLTGRWWLIPLAITAGALIYAKIKSMQAGGVVPETGPYLLHRGERVVPAPAVEIQGNIEGGRFTPPREVETRMITETTKIYRTKTEYIVPRSVQSFGPIFVTFERQPREGPDMDEWLRELGPRIVERARRG
jgi:hypothetical protein